MTNEARPRKPRGSIESLEVAGEEEVLSAIAAGSTIGEIAGRYDVCRDTVYNWIKAGGSDRVARWEEAKTRSADALAERAGEILDELAAEPASQVTPALVALAGKRSEYSRWLAGTRNPETFGGDRATGITVNIGTLHLDALRAVGSMTKPELAPIEDALLITDGGEE